MTDRNALRRKIRQQRASLSRQDIAHASLLASARLVTLPVYRRAKRIAAYIAAKGEIDPLPAVLHATYRGKQCYLPRLHPFLKNRMWFIRWQPGDKLVENNFGIPEPLPSPGKRLPAWMLDCVIVPLVAFDKQRNRMGMGQGFYDLAFAFKHHRKRWGRPVLCGFSHDFQQVDSLDTQVWDIPMDVIVTPHKVI